MAPKPAALQPNWLRKAGPPSAVTGLSVQPSTPATKPEKRTAPLPSFKRKNSDQSMTTPITSSSAGQTATPPASPKEDVALEKSTSPTRDKSASPTPPPVPRPEAQSIPTPTKTTAAAVPPSPSITPSVASPLLLTRPEIPDVLDVQEIPDVLDVQENIVEDREVAALTNLLGAEVISEEPQKA